LGSQPPKIQPGAVVEGGSINVLCIAMGTPAPSVSLYVSGMLAHTEKETRHLVVTLHNITRHMRQLSCYADNGFGTPMQASKQIVVNCKSEIMHFFLLLFATNIVENYYFLLYPAL
jgi:hypothetical protein